MKKLKHKRSRDIKIRFGYKDEIIHKLGRVVYGQCDIEKGLVLMNPKYWNSLSHDSRVLLIFHEMGHCDLLLDHVHDKNDVMNKDITDRQVNMGDVRRLINRKKMKIEKMVNEGLYIEN